jgi:phasin family protein
MSVKSKSEPKLAVENVESMVKASTAAAQEHIEKTVVMTKSRVDAAIKSLEEITTFSTGNVEAVVASSQAAAKAIETLNTEALSFARTSFEGSVAAAKAMAGAKSLQEIVDLQNTFSKSAIDGFVAQSTKLGEMFTQLSKEAMQPLSARMNAAAEKMRLRAA